MTVISSVGITNEYTPFVAVIAVALPAAFVYVSEASSYPVSGVTVTVTVPLFWACVTSAVPTLTDIDPFKTPVLFVTA